MSLHLYMVTDAVGSWPLISLHELPWEAFRTPPLTVLPLGTFALWKDALREAAAYAAANQALTEDSGTVQPAAEVGSGPRRDAVRDRSLRLVKRPVCAPVG